MVIELALMQIDYASKLNRSIWASRHGVLPLKVNDLALMEIKLALMLNEFASKLIPPPLFEVALS